MKKFNELAVGDTIYTAYCADGKLKFSKHIITDIMKSERGSIEVMTFQSYHKYTTESGGLGCEYFDADIRQKDMCKSRAYHGDYWKDRIHYTDASMKDEVSALLLMEALKFEEKRIEEKRNDIEKIEKDIKRYKDLMSKLKTHK